MPDVRISLNTSQTVRLPDGERVRLVPSDYEPPDPEAEIVAHYDATEENTGTLSTLLDQEGGYDLEGSAEVVADGINGEQAYYFDGSDDAANDEIELEEPFAIALVYELPDAGTEGHLFDCGPDSDEEFYIRNHSSAGIQHDAGHFRNDNRLSWIESTAGPNVLFLDVGERGSAAFYNHSSGIRVNGVDRISGYPAEQSRSDPDDVYNFLEGLSVANAAGGGETLEVTASEILLYDNPDEELLSDEEERLLDKYGIDRESEDDLDEPLIHGTGSWGINNRPQAVYDDETDTTYWTWHGERGAAGCSAYHHDTGELEHGVAEVVNTMPGDDHWAATIHIRDDGHLQMFYARDGDMHQAVSTDPYDVTDWETETHELTNNYPMPIVPWDGADELWLLTLPNSYELGNGDSVDQNQCLIFYSDNEGQTWDYDDHTVLVDLDDEDERVYVHPYADHDNDRIHFVMGDENNDPSGMYYWYWDLDSDEFCQADGTVIQDADEPITDKHDVDVVDEEFADGDGADSIKNYDIIVDDDGRPCLGYIKHEENPRKGPDQGDWADPEYADLRAYWAGFNPDDGEWVTSEITEVGTCMADNHIVSGGVLLDAIDPTIVRISVEQDDRNFQVQEWQTDDWGETFEKARDLSPAGETVDQPTKRYRAKSPRNHNGEIPAIYCAGMYYDFERHNANMELVYGESGDWNEW